MNTILLFFFFSWKIKSYLTRLYNCRHDFEHCSFQKRNEIQIIRIFDPCQVVRK